MAAAKWNLDNSDRYFDDVSPKSHQHTIQSQSPHHSFHGWIWWFLNRDFDIKCKYLDIDRWSVDIFVDIYSDNDAHLNLSSHGVSTHCNVETVCWLTLDRTLSDPVCGVEAVPCWLLAGVRWPHWAAHPLIVIARICLYTDIICSGRTLKSHS